MRFSRYILALLLALLAAWPSFSQSRKRQGSVMEYTVIGNDTVYVDVLPPARVHPKEYMNRAEWIQYYQRVHNFSKAYPYALFVAKTIHETDSIFLARHYTKREQDRYLETMKEELLKCFDPLMRDLTLKQGMMMIRLIDREVGKTPYAIIQQYLGNVNAGFWQGIAKMFKGDIKREYDPKGEDQDLERLVVYWHDGEFDDLYEFIFGKPRPKITIPKQFQKPFYMTVDTKQSKKDARRAAREERKNKRK